MTMTDDNETFTLITMDDMAVVFSVTDDFRQFTGSR